MTQAQVEAILGPPNDIQGRRQLEKLAQNAEDSSLGTSAQAALARRRQDGEFWDAYSFGRWGRYIGVTVYYDEEGKVRQTRVDTFWRHAWE
jgi:hypothetical protein